MAHRRHPAAAPFAVRFRRASTAELTRNVRIRVRLALVPGASRRLNVMLDPAYAAKLAKLAERTHVNEGTLARLLLTQALDQADPHPRDVAALLDGLAGALGLANQGLKDARAGRTVKLDDI